MSYLQKITKGSVIFSITASYTAKKKKKEIKPSLFHSLFVDHFDPSTQPGLSQAFLSVLSLIFRNSSPDFLKDIQSSFCGVGWMNLHCFI